MINVQCECKNLKEHHACKKIYSTTCSCKNGKYLASFIDDSVITCDKIVNDADTVSTNGSENAMNTVLKKIHDKKVRYKQWIFVIYTQICQWSYYHS